MNPIRPLSRIICMTFAALLPLAAYSSPQSSPKSDPAPTPQKAEIALAPSSLQHDTSPSVAAAALVELNAGNTDFAYDLYQAIRKESGNLCYSPFSISTALAMVYAGARGETERQIANALHFTLAQDQLHPALNALGLDLAPASPDAPTSEPGFAGTSRSSLPNGLSRPARRKLRGQVGLAGFRRSATQRAKPIDDKQLGQQSHLGQYRKLVCTGNPDQGHQARASQCGLLQS